MKQSLIVSRRLSVTTKKQLFLIMVFSLFTVYCPVFTASAQDITARGAVVMEASTGRILYAKNPTLRLAPASTTKVMTAILVIEKANLNSKTTISYRAAHVAPHKKNLKAGDSFTIEDLLYAALMESANDAAVALSEAVSGSEEEFVKEMNLKAIEIGAYNTHYINATGLPGKGQYITAYDLAKIMRYAMKNPTFREIISTREKEIVSSSGCHIALKNIDKLLWKDDEVIGGKTGFTFKARHCFVGNAGNEGKEVIVSLLGSSSRSNLWHESEELIDRGYRVIAMQEEPEVYISRAGDEHEAYGGTIKKVSYHKVANPHHTYHKKIKSIHKKVYKKKVIAKERVGKKKTIVRRHRLPKRSRLARVKDDGNKG